MSVDKPVVRGRRDPTAIFYLWRPFLRDANDDMVLEVAVEAQCPFIVTFNTRVFAGVEQFGIQTLTPGQFLARLQEDA